MEAVNDLSLRVPSDLLAEVTDLAAREDTSVEAFLIRAAEERVAALRARATLAEWAARARPGDFLRILEEAGSDGPLRPGDELPEGWPAPRTSRTSP